MCSKWPAPRASQPRLPLNRPALRYDKPVDSDAVASRTPRATPRSRPSQVPIQPAPTWGPAPAPAQELPAQSSQHAPSSPSSPAPRPLAWTYAPRSGTAAPKCSPPPASQSPPRCGPHQEHRVQWAQDDEACQPPSSRHKPSVHPRRQSRSHNPSRPYNPCAKSNL